MKAVAAELPATGPAPGDLQGRRGFRRFREQVQTLYIGPLSNPPRHGEGNRPQDGGGWRRRKQRGDLAITSPPVSPRRRGSRVPNATAAPHNPGPPPTRGHGKGGADCLTACRTPAKAGVHWGGVGCIVAFLQSARYATIFPIAEPPTHRTATPPAQNAHECELSELWTQKRGRTCRPTPPKQLRINGNYPVARASARFSFSCAAFLIWQIRAAPTPSTCPISSRFSSST